MKGKIRRNGKAEIQIIYQDLWLQQTYITRLLEVMVCRKCLCHVTLLHQYETRAIYKSPLLIISLFEKFPRLPIKSSIYMDNFYIWRGFQTLHECSNSWSGDS